MVSPWQAYSVVLPEGCTLYTGTADVMFPILNAVLGVEMTDANNAVLEGLTDGDYNHVVVNQPVEEPEETPAE